jgi:hypothetical protein
MQILSTRSKVSSRGFYESFTFNKRCNLYVCDTFVRLREGCDDVRYTSSSIMAVVAQTV